MTQSRSPMLGAAIAAAVMAYAIAEKRRRRRQGAVALVANGERGRLADAPEEITLAGWRDILQRFLADISRDNVSLMAAGIAFYGLMSLAPAFTALVALYGLVADPAVVQAQVAGLEGMVPPEARSIIAAELTAIVQAHSSSLGVGFVLGLVIAFWSANYATGALISALNVAYGEEEKRGLLRYYASALLLTVCAVGFGALALLLIAVIPAILNWLPIAPSLRTLSLLRWPVLLLLFAIGLGVIYRYAPSRNQPRWRWVSWGAAAATLLWIAGSALFSIYVDRFATYNKTYGSLGAVVVLLMWLWLSAYVVLLGAELDAEMEHQTARDTTDRPAKPMGRRGAYVADTVAR
jgi:membrane protein